MGSASVARVAASGVLVAASGVVCDSSLFSLEIQKMGYNFWFYEWILTKLHIYYKNFLLYWEWNMSENILIKNKFNKYFEPLPKRESR